MNPRILFAAFALSLPMLSQAQDIIGGSPERQSAEAPAPEVGSPGIFETADLALRLYRLESRVTEIEDTQLDEADVRRIAEDVFRKMSLTIAKPEGGQRAAVVDAAGGSAAIQLAPGEVLVGYTDPLTGRYVKMQQATAGTMTYREASSGEVVVQQVGDVATVRRPATRAVGRVVSAPFRAAGAATCRIVNSRQVCN
jgi:hypothetical protein